MEYETKTQITETHVQTNLRWDPAYIKEVAGALKLAAILVDLACLVCALMLPPHLGEEPTAEWFVFTCMTAFWVSLVLLIMYLVHAIEKFHVIPWLMIEFGFYALWAFFYFTAALAFAVEGAGSPAMGAGAFFGFLGCILYSVDAFFKFRGWRQGQIAQGERKVTQPNQRY